MDKGPVIIYDRGGLSQMTFSRKIFGRPTRHAHEKFRRTNIFEVQRVGKKSGSTKWASKKLFLKIFTVAAGFFLSLYTPSNIP